MIVLKIRGGIGNQLFQYVFGRTLAIKYSTAFVLDTTWYRNADRPFVLDALKTVYKARVGNRFIMRGLNFFSQPRIIREGVGLEEIAVKPHENILLEGYREASPKHAYALQNLLEKELILKNPSKSFLKYSRDIDRNNTIAVHVRRGDFLKPTSGRVVQDAEYFIQAIRKLVREQDLSNPSIIVFSDDVVWCKEYLATIDAHAITIFEDALISDIEQMFLMSLPKYIVIANSTFSWWAAFLNQHQNKVVIAPTQWYTDEKLNEVVTMDLIHPTWSVL